MTSMTLPLFAPALFMYVSHLVHELPRKSLRKKLDSKSYLYYDNHNINDLSSNNNYNK